MGTIASNIQEDLDAGSAMFINVETTKGLLQFAAYNEHNGYYGHGVKLVSKYNDKTVIMVYYVTVSGYIQEVRFDTDSTLHQLLRKAGKLYRSEEEAKRYLDKDYKDLIIQEEE